jgi:hypothetical protein
MAIWILTAAILSCGNYFGYIAPISRLHSLYSVELGATVQNVKGCRFSRWLFSGILLFMSMGWDYISGLPQKMGPLFIRRWSISIDSHGVMILTGCNRIKTCLNATLPTTNPTWTDPGANLGLRGERSATKRLNHGSAVSGILHRLLL